MNDLPHTVTVDGVASQVAPDELLVKVINRAGVPFAGRLLRFQERWTNIWIDADTD